MPIGSFARQNGSRADITVRAVPRLARTEPQHQPGVADERPKRSMDPSGFLVRIGLVSTRDVSTPVRLDAGQVRPSAR